MSAAPRVLLTGMMGAGKSTIGRVVAQRSGWTFLDNDDLVERATGATTPEVLVDAGEVALRRVEADALDEALAAPAPLVAGVAAGVIEDPAARERMHREGFVVYLRAPIAVLAERVGSGGGRPWLGEDPAEALAQLYEGREPLYEETAHLVLDVAGRTPDDLAERIIDAATD